MKTTKYALAIALGLTALLSPKTIQANTLTYSASGTFSASTSFSAYSGPGDTWALSFQVSSNPVVFNVVPGEFFDFTPLNFSYSLNGSPVAITPTFARFLTASGAVIPGGGWSICFASDCIDSLGTSGPQMYSGSESAPTLLAGVFTSTGTFVDVSGSVFTEPNSTVTGAPVAAPEPSSLLLLGTGLLGLMGMGLYKKRLA